MDLFGDLPEPEKDKVNKDSESTKISTKQIFFNDERNVGSKRIHDNDELPNLKRKSKDGNVIQLNEKTVVESTDVKQFGDFHVQSFLSERKGERDDMQDASVRFDDFKLEMKKLNDKHDFRNQCNLSYYGVYDGHNGSRASKFCSENMHVYLAEKLLKCDNIEKEIKKCFIDVYKKTDDAFLAKASLSKPSWKDGSTSTSVLLINNKAFVASVGDSKAILYRFDEKKNRMLPIPLTIDHNPTSYEERMRIQRSGGIVKEGRVLGQLEVSRSIGDGQYKNHGVSCIPDIKQCSITPQDRLLLVACDGLWKKYTPLELGEFLEKRTTVLKSKHENLNAYKIELEDICNQLANLAVKGLVADNVTICIVAFFHHK